MVDDSGKPNEVDIDKVREYINRPIWQLLRVGLPAKVTSFLRDTARVAGDLVSQFKDTTRAFRAETPVEDVPVMFPGGDGYGFYHDLAVDDPVFLVAGDAEHRGFWEDGSTVLPTTNQRHSYGCAVAFPGGRVSSSTPGQETPAPNAAGECLAGARDGTATLLLRRARPDAAPPELGTVVIKSAGPLASLLLGGDAATLGVARLGDPVAASTPMNTVLSAVVAAINVLTPGTVTPPQLAAALTHLGDICGASEKVVSE